MEIGFGHLYLSYDALPDDKVTEAFAVFPLFGPATEEVVQSFQDRRFAHVFAVELRHAGPDTVAAEVEVVFARALADEAGLSQHRAATAIRAADNSLDDVVVWDAVLG